MNETAGSDPRPSTHQPEPAAVRVGAAPTIRVANKALIVRGRELLVTVNADDTDGQIFWLPPGGGQEWGEDAVGALQRECREELGCDVVVRALACVRDYVGKNHRFAHLDSWFHQQENFFFCDLAPGAQPRHDPATGDDRQVGVAWVSFDELRAGNFAPNALLDWLEADPATRPGYLGDVG